jgi:hypothetical protein
MCTRGRLLLATRHAKTFTDTMTGASDNAAVSVLSVGGPETEFRDPQMSSISRQHSILFGCRRFGRMR